MATIVKSYEINENGVCTFRTTSGMELRVYSFNKGIATVDSLVEYPITSFMKMIVGCFEEKSNFEKKILKAFNCKKGTTLSGVKFEFNNESLLVTIKKSKNNKIYAKWLKNEKSIRDTHKL